MIKLSLKECKVILLQISTTANADVLYDLKLSVWKGKTKGLKFNSKK